MTDIDPRHVFGDARGVHYRSAKAAVLWEANEYRLIQVKGFADTYTSEELVLEIRDGTDTMGVERWAPVRSLDSFQIQLLLTHVLRAINLVALPSQESQGPL